MDINTNILVSGAVECLPQVDLGTDEVTLAGEVVGGLFQRWVGGFGGRGGEYV